MRGEEITPETSYFSFEQYNARQIFKGAKLPFYPWI